MLLNCTFRLNIPRSLPLAGSKKKKKKMLLYTLFFCNFAATAASGPSPPTNLLIEHLTSPARAIDTVAPRFSWSLPTSSDPTNRGAKQSAYEIVVNASSAVPLWTSGVVQSDSSTYVLYKGPALKSDTTYTWAVRWRRALPGSSAPGDWSAFSAVASFDTGIFSTEEWHGATWLGCPTSTPSPTNGRFIRPEPSSPCPGGNTPAGMP